jgi:hypothetical protein
MNVQSSQQTHKIQSAISVVERDCSIFYVGTMTMTKKITSFPSVPGQILELLRNLRRQLDVGPAEVPV